MIANRDRGFVCFSIPKTASESVRAALSSLAQVKVSTLEETDSQQPFYNHMTAQEFFQTTEDQFQTLVSTVRNPFDRISSLYSMFLRSSLPYYSSLSLDTFLHDVCPNNPYDKSFGKGWIRNGPKTQVDFLSNRVKPVSTYRIESDLRLLEEDLSNLFNTKVEIHHKNKTSRLKPNNLTREQKKIIELKYALDFETLGY